MAGDPPGAAEAGRRPTTRLCRPRRTRRPDVDGEGAEAEARQPRLRTGRATPRCRDQHATNRPRAREAWLLDFVIRSRLHSTCVGRRLREHDSADRATVLEELPVRLRPPGPPTVAPRIKVLPPPVDSVATAFTRRNWGCENVCNGTTYIAARAAKRRASDCVVAEGDPRLCGGA